MILSSIYIQFAWLTNRINGKTLQFIEKQKTIQDSSVEKREREIGKQDDENFQICLYRRTTRFLWFVSLSAGELCSAWIQTGRGL